MAPPPSRQAGAGQAESQAPAARQEEGTPKPRWGARSPRGLRRAAAEVVSFSSAFGPVRDPPGGRPRLALPEGLALQGPGDSLQCILGMGADRVVLGASR